MNRNVKKNRYLTEMLGMKYPNQEILLNIKRNQENGVREILDRRNIKFFVHFTRIENLSNILNNGLIPVSMQEKMRINSVHNDEQRLDSQLDCTSCSVTFPNYKLFYFFRKTKFPDAKWAIIVLNPDVLFSPDNIVYFCPTNAASVLPKTSNLDELCYAKSFEDMFKQLITTKENKKIYRSSLKIADYMTTDPQAEILISDIIDKKHIFLICFRSETDYEFCIDIHGASLFNRFEIGILPELFSPRRDYAFWTQEG